MSDTPPREPRTEDPEPGSRAPRLSELQKRRADAEAGADARTTYEVIRREGERELERSLDALTWSGLAGGLAMGLSHIAQGTLMSHLPHTLAAELIGNLGYPLGFLIVILGNQQLYTENTLRPVVPYLAKRTRDKLRKLLLLSLVVLLGNVAGTALIAWAAAHTTLFTSQVRDSMLEVARMTIAPDTPTLFVRAVLAGWLIALLVWMLPAARGAKVLVIFIITYIIVVTRSQHVITGSAEAWYTVAAGAAGFGDYLRWFIPVLTGNTVGGVLIVALLNHAQVVGSGGRSVHAGPS